LAEIVVGVLAVAGGPMRPRQDPPRPRRWDDLQTTPQVPTQIMSQARSMVAGEL